MEELSLSLLSEALRQQSRPQSIALTLKKSLVASKPIEVNAVPAAPGSPKELKTLIDVASDQPLKRNIFVHGELGKADFVEQQLEKEKVEPVHLSKEAEKRLKNWKNTAKAEDIIQIDILEKSNTEKIQKAVLESLEAKSVATEGSVYDVWMNLEGITLTTKKEVQNLAERAVTQMYQIGNTEAWSDRTVRNWRIRHTRVLISRLIPKVNSISVFQKHGNKLLPIRLGMEIKFLAEYSS